MRRGRIEVPKGMIVISASRLGPSAPIVRLAERPEERLPALSPSPPYFPAPRGLTTQWAVHLLSDGVMPRAAPALRGIEGYFRLKPRVFLLSALVARTQSEIDAAG